MSRGIPSPRVTLIVVVVAAVLRWWAAIHLPLSGDEAYHWEWSRRLAGAYYDHPGLTAWLIALSTTLLPAAAEAAVRLPALVCMLAATAVAYGFAKDLARARAADSDTAARAGALAAMLVFFVPLPVGLSVYMSTDPPLVLFWLAAVWAFHRAIATGSTAAWLISGLCVGLAVATKLIGLQLLASFGVFLLCWREGRRWLRRPQPWLALMVALLATIPMLWWNALNDWLTFRFNFAIRQREEDASIWHPLVFVAGQAGMLTPGFMALALGVSLARANRARAADAAVVVSVLLPLLFFAGVSLRREVGAHWAASPWLVAFVVLATDWVTRLPWVAGRWTRIAWRSSWALAVVVLIATHAFAVAPMFVADLDLVAGQPRTVLRNLFGWRQLGEATAVASEALRRERADAGATPGVFVMADQYGTAAAVAFYTPGQPSVHLWSAPRKHGRNYFYWDDWSALRGQDAVYVSKRALSSWELPLLREHFTVVSEVEEVAIERGGAVRNRFFLVRCRGFDGRPPFPRPA